MSENSNLSADFVTILSSELIAKVVEEYFNRVMFKMPITIVDLKPTADGYAFSLAFVEQKQIEKVVLCEHNENTKACWLCEGLEVAKDEHFEAVETLRKPKRAKNGKFTTAKEL